MSFDAVEEQPEAAPGRDDAALPAVRGPGRREIVLALGVLALVAVVARAFLAPEPTADPGRLQEPAIERPSTVPLPVLVDATTAWGLDALVPEPADDAMAGGAAVADLDGDGALDLIVANGDVAIARWNGSGYDPPRLVGVTGAIGVTTADLDADGASDLLVATAADADLILWGGAWVVEGSEPEVTGLAADGPTSALLAAELSGDDRLDIVRLGRGGDDPVADVLWTAGAGDGREYSAQTLPAADRFSLAAEIFDVDVDGLLDIWITRDVGWDRGPDSVLSRRGDPAGEWIDIAAELGADLEIDGMGITVADLDGDAVLDAYISDLGDNELLLGGPGRRFRQTFDTGAAHIRPVGAGPDVVSSTWATGALDVNLDGVLDLVLASGGFPDGTVRNKIEDTEVAVEEPPAVLLGLGDGSFVDVWPELGLEVSLVARGLTIADLDGDGDDDFVVVDRRGQVTALRNDTTGPTVTVRPEPGCGDLAGIAVTVTTSPQGGGAETVFQRLLRPHTYAGAHGAAVIVGLGDPQATVNADATRGGRPLVFDLIAYDNDRTTMVLECP